MGTSSGIFALLFALLSGGANDMLDFVSSDAYWKAKGVTVSVEQLTADLKAPAAADVAAFIKALGSGSYPEREEAAKKIIAVGLAAIPSLEKSIDDPDAEIANHARNLIQQIRLNSKANSVRRLMAIRTLGEMKKPEGLPALKALLDSKEMFVADYTARSIAQIEGKPAPARTIAADALKADLSLLPANCAIIGQTQFHGGKAFNLEQMMKEMPAQPGEDRTTAMNMMINGIIQVADQVGNIRVESVTIGVSDVVGQNDGFAAIVIRGQYDAQAVSALVGKSVPNGTTIDGVQILSPEEHIAFAFLSDTRAMAMTGASKEKLPLKEMLAATRAKPNAAGHPLLAMPEFAPFVTSLNDTTRAWAVCKVSDSYRAAPPIAPFDTITLLGTQEKAGMSIRIAGAGKDAAAVKGAVDMINSELAQAKQEMPKVAKQVPALKPIADFIEGIKCDADGKSATLAGSFQGDITSLLAMPFMMFSRAEPQLAQPAQVQENVKPDTKK